MKYAILVIVRAHLYLVLIVAASYILEKITGLILITAAFSEEKIDADYAKGNTDLFTLLYFFYQLIFFLYDVNKKPVPESFSFWIWLTIVTPLTVVFWNVYHKYQVREPGTKDSND